MASGSPPSSPVPYCTLFRSRTPKIGDGGSGGGGDEGDDDDGGDDIIVFRLQNINSE